MKRLNKFKVGLNAWYLEYIKACVFVYRYSLFVIAFYFMSKSIILGTIFILIVYTGYFYKDEKFDKIK